MHDIVFDRHGKAEAPAWPWPGGQDLVVTRVTRIVLEYTDDAWHRYLQKIMYQFEPELFLRLPGQCVRVQSLRLYGCTSPKHDPPPAKPEYRCSDPGAARARGPCGPCARHRPRPPASGSRLTGRNHGPTITHMCVHNIRLSHTQGNDPPSDGTTDAMGVSCW